MKKTVVPPFVPDYKDQPIEEFFNVQREEDDLDDT